MKFMDSFAEKHPKAAEWIRKGGLFLIFSWVVTALKAVMLMFLPDFYRGFVGNAEWLWPNIPVALWPCSASSSTWLSSATHWLLVAWPILWPT